jgi:hypothetical protein
MPPSQSSRIVTVSQPVDLGRGALGVAEVGEKEAGVAPQTQAPLVPREAGQVADVGQVGDQTQVELALGAASASGRRDPRIRRRDSSSLASAASASR